LYSIRVKIKIKFGLRGTYKCSHMHTLKNLRVVNLDHNQMKIEISVADPECLFQILVFFHPRSQISDPGYRIPVPTTTKKTRRTKFS
jgi:hypothetical protein